MYFILFGRGRPLFLFRLLRTRILVPPNESSCLVILLIDFQWSGFVSGAREIAHRIDFVPLQMRMRHFQHAFGLPLVIRHVRVDPTWESNIGSKSAWNIAISIKKKISLIFEHAASSQTEAIKIDFGLISRAPETRHCQWSPQKNV